MNSTTGVQTTVPQPKIETVIDIHEIVKKTEKEKKDWEKSFEKIREIAGQLTTDITKNKLDEMISTVYVEMKKLEKSNDKIVKYATTIQKIIDPKGVVNIVAFCCVNILMYGLAGAGFGVSCFVSDDLNIRVILYVMSYVPFLIPVISDTVIKVFANIAARFSEYNTLLNEAINQTRNLNEVLLILRSIKDNLDKEDQKLMINELFLNCVALIDQKKENLLSRQEKHSGELLSHDQCDNFLSTVVSLVLPKTEDGQKIIKKISDSKNELIKKISNAELTPKNSTVGVLTKKTNSMSIIIKSENNSLEKSSSILSNVVNELENKKTENKESIENSNTIVIEEVKNKEEKQKNEGEFHHKYLNDHEDENISWGGESLRLIDDQSPYFEKEDIKSAAQQCINDLDEGFTEIEKKFNLPKSRLQFFYRGNTKIIRPNGEKEKSSLASMLKRSFVVVN